MRFVVVFWLVMSTMCKSQVFAPMGAFWKYYLPGQNAPDSVQCKSYYLFEVKKDTFIANKTAKIISRKEYKNEVLQNEVNFEFFHTENKKVYVLNKITNNYNLLFDFEAKTGDTIKVFNNQGFNYFFSSSTVCGLKYFTYKITGVDSISLNNQLFLRQKVESVCPESLSICNPCWGFQGKEGFIYEKIGVANNYHSFMGNYLGEGIVASGSSGLYYYNDSYFTYGKNCTPTTIGTIQEKSQIYWSQLSNTEIVVDFKSQINLTDEYELFDLNGKKANVNFSTHSTKLFISLQSNPKGIYFLVFKDKNKKISVTKISFQ